MPATTNLGDESQFWQKVFMPTNPVRGVVLVASRPVQVPEGFAGEYFNGQVVGLDPSDRSQWATGAGSDLLDQKVAF